MALEFTTIPDREGPAVYLLGHAGCEDRVKKLGEEIDSTTDEAVQTVYIDIQSADGSQLAEFYGFSLEQVPVVMIVQDDDTIYQQWMGSDLPAADVVAHFLDQITGTSGA